MNPIKPFNVLVGNDRTPQKGEDFYGFMFVGQVPRVYIRHRTKKTWKKCERQLNLKSLACDATQIELVGKEIAFTAVRGKFVEDIRTRSTCKVSALRISEEHDIAVVRVYRS